MTKRSNIVLIDIISAHREIKIKIDHYYLSHLFLFLHHCRYHKMNILEPACSYILLVIIPAKRAKIIDLKLWHFVMTNLQGCLANVLVLRWHPNWSRWAASHRNAWRTSWRKLGKLHATRVKRRRPLVRPRRPAQTFVAGHNLPQKKIKNTNYYFLIDTGLTVIINNYF